MIVRSLSVGFLCLGLMMSSVVKGQQEGKELPRGLTDVEKSMVSSYVPPDASSFTIPFAGLRGSSFRTMAEWEELQAVVITWAGQQAILAEIVRNLQEECQVLIVCSNEATVKNYLAGKGIDWSKNVIFLPGAFNSIWVRDYGPNCIYSDDVDSLYLVDWIYNRPRPSDDLVPGIVGGKLGIPVVSMASKPNDLVHTGGNFMSDGLGTAFSSHLVLEENGPGSNWALTVKDEATVDALMSNLMGISPYIKMENLPFDGIHHIDMHMKLLDERTLLVGKYPDGIADGPQIEANIQYVLSGFTAADGSPFRVVRIPMPPDASGKYPHQGGHYRTYTNSLIANRTIIVPTYEEKYDTTALRIYRELMPGYQVNGIDCNAIIPLSGALHCITKEIGVNDPLRIVHFPVDGSNITVDGVPVTATIQHRDGIVGALLHYSTDTLLGFQAIAMEKVPGSDSWMAYIPSLDGDDQIVYYYISAESNSGKKGARPITAPKGHWNFLMEGKGTSSTEATGSKGMPLTLPVSVFPNPARAITCITLQPGAYRGPLRVELVDVLGNSQRLWEGVGNQSEQKVFFDAGFHPAGAYTLRVSAADRIATTTLIISR